MVSLRVRGAREFNTFAVIVRGGEEILDEEMGAAFRQAGADTLRRIKGNVEGMEIKGYRTGRKKKFTAIIATSNLRRRISSVTDVEVSTSGRPSAVFTVDAELLGSAGSLPWHFDRGRRFRHPIMGNRSTWAANSGTPWFYVQISHDLDEFRKACDIAITKTVYRIENG